jgi:hypothetical protein
MHNKKVYLAKNTLASGFDVEYVKSHLLRIPGIIIIEPGTQISPSECEAFVIVPDAHFDENSDSVSLSKNVAQALEEFIGDYDGSNDISECVYIFSHSKPTDESQDVEQTFPICSYPEYEFEVDLLDKDNYDAFGSVNLVQDDTVELLHCVSELIDADHGAWIRVPRHFSPPPEFAMPPVPSLEERLLKKGAIIMDSTGHMSASTHIIDFSSGDKRLLLLRRK